MLYSNAIMDYEILDHTGDICVRVYGQSFDHFLRNAAWDMNEEIKLTKIHDYLWEIPKSGRMRVPGRVYASESMTKGMTLLQQSI